MIVRSMSHFLEAVALLLPPDAGGRDSAISPRDGSYRPFACSDQARIRIRMIEGPPSLEPGQAARVFVEVERGEVDSLAHGAELTLCENDTIVGQLTVLRVIREAVAI